MGTLPDTYYSLPHLGSVYQAPSDPCESFCIAWCTAPFRLHLYGARQAIPLLNQDTLAGITIITLGFTIYFLGPLVNMYVCGLVSPVVTCIFGFHIAQDNFVYFIFPQRLFFPLPRHRPH